MTSRGSEFHLPGRLPDFLRRAIDRVRSTRNPEIQDAVQEAVTRVLAATASGQVIEAPNAFATRTLRNLAIDETRKRRIRGGNPLPLDDLNDATATWVSPDQEAALLLKQVVLALPPIYRDTFVLNRFVGLTYDQIAQRYGITTKAVEYRMSRALALCQTALCD